MKKIFLSIISLLLLVTLSACGKENVKEDNKKEDNSVTETSSNTTNEVIENNDNTSTSTEEVSGVGEFKALYSDQTKMVFQYTDNSKIVFHHNGTQITGYELYYNYEDAATANIAKDTITNEHDADVNRVYVDGSMLVVVYNESAYRDLTLEDVRTVYSYLKEVTN